jgi:hypothetical protein
VPSRSPSYFTGPRYRSSQASVYLMSSLRGRKWSVSYNLSLLCSAGVPSKSNIGFTVASKG